MVTGPTGAGKSSILDAITFALYGNVARVNGRELRDLISHGASYVRVCLDFEVGATHYRVARRMGRTGHDVTLERIDGDSSFPELERGGVRVVNQRLEEIIGLDFDAFTKAVLLPQGAFSEFLNGDVRERRRILMRLLDLGRYERAGQAARREANRLDTIIETHEALIESNYRQATKEQLRELEADLKTAREQHRKIDQARRDSRQIAEAAAEAARKIDVLAEGQQGIGDTTAELERLQEVRPALEAESTQSQEQLSRAERSLADAEKAQQRAQKALATTTNRTGDVALLARLEEATAALRSEQAEISRLDGELAGAGERATELAGALDAATKAERVARKAIASSARARQEAEAQFRLAGAVAHCAERASELARLEQQLAPLEKKAAQLRGDFDKAREKAAHLEQEHAAIALRAGLSPGDHCPVCDSIIESIPSRPRDIESVLAKTRNAVASAEAHEQEGRNALVALQARCHTAGDELKKAHKALPAGVEIPEPAVAVAALARAETALQEAQETEFNAQDALDQTVQRLSEAKTNAGRAAEQVKGLAQSRKGAERRRDAALVTLAKGFPAKLPRDVDAAIARRREELNTAQEAHKSAVDAVGDAHKALDEAHTASADAAKRVSAFDNELATTLTAARIACETIAKVLGDQRLPTFPSHTLERAARLSATQKVGARHSAAADAAITRYRKDEEGATEKLRRLAEKAGARITSTDAAEITNELERAVVDAHGVLVAAQKDVATQKEQIKTRRKLEQAIVDDRILRALYTTLARELQTDHFISYVLAESMNQLSDQASLELLQISDSRYSLIAESDNFEVVDHHNADERRSVATLSGGETFLASLSLALALSAGLRELASTAAARLDAIFIDEGFGALDPETLGVVVDALERLREGDRMVGVITHVPDLGERITRGLSVEKNGNSSTIVARS